MGSWFGDGSYSNCEVIVRVRKLVPVESATAVRTPSRAAAGGDASA